MNNVSEEMRTKEIIYRVSQADITDRPGWPRCLLEHMEMSDFVSQDNRLALLAERWNVPLEM